MVQALTRLGGHVEHPVPVNQFYRLEYDEVRDVFLKTTRWNNINKGHNFDAENCMAAEGAVAIDAHTSGSIRTSPAGIRNYQGDFVGGIGIDDVDEAWHRHFDKDLITPKGESWSETIATVKAERRHVSIAVDYRKVPAEYKAQTPGNFDHAMGIDDVRDSDGWILIYDSLRTMPIWVPQSAIRAGAESIALRERGTAGSLFVGFGATRPALGMASPHYEAIVTKATSLWNDKTKQWVYKDVAGPTDNRIKPGTKLEVRGARYTKGGVVCYPITSGVWSTLYDGYFVPVKNVKLGDIT